MESLGFAADENMKAVRYGFRESVTKKRVIGRSGRCSTSLSLFSESGRVADRHDSESPFGLSYQRTYEKFRCHLKKVHVIGRFHLPWQKNTFALSAPMEKEVSVLHTTTVSLQEFQKDDDQDRQATLPRGVTLLELNMTVNEAGLEDGEGISILWSAPFLEIDAWKGPETGKDLYVRTPTKTKSIDSSAFTGCRDLVKVVIPDSVTWIGECAFYDCRSLTQVEIPNSVSAVGDGAFCDCSSLTQVKMPNSVTSIGEYAFRDCILLTQVEISNSVTSIGREAFLGCSSLRQVKIPNSVTRKEKETFTYCTAVPWLKWKSQIL